MHVQRSGTKQALEVADSISNKADAVRLTHSHLELAGACFLLISAFFPERYTC